MPNKMAQTATGEWFLSHRFSSNQNSMETSFPGYPAGSGGNGLGIGDGALRGIVQRKFAAALRHPHAQYIDRRAEW